MNNPTETKTTTGVCPACNYDLQGVIPNEDRRITCPECGITLRPRKTDDVLTTIAVNQYFLKYLTLPTAGPALGLLLISWVPNIGLLLGLLHTPIMAVWSFTLWIVISAKLTSRSRPHPRPGPLWLIPILGLLYLLPVTVLTFAYWMIGSYFIIPV